MSRFRNSLLVTSTLVMAGCGPRVVSPSNPAGGEQGAAAKNDATTKVVSSDDVLASAIYQLRPENFGINSATDKPVSLLNSWRFKQAEKGEFVDEPLPVKAPPGWVAADDETRLAQSKFDAMDAMHIRDALFERAMSGYLSDRGRDELERVGIVVDFVCRNVALWNDDEIELPMLPYLTMQVGRGSADDRAWVCAAILKQLRLDCVVIRPKKGENANDDRWLFGVIFDNQIYLYDLRLGLPVTNGTPDSSSSVAALSTIVDHPEWLEQMSVNEPYRLTVEDLRDPAIFVISQPEFWCRRMSSLEQVLPPSDICVLYDSLLDDDSRPGLLRRIATAGAWPVESLKLWAHPRRQREELRQPKQENAQEWERLMLPFLVPVPVSLDKAGNQVKGTPERKQQRFRSDQLLGKFAEATKRYLSIRHLEVEPNPPDLERLNRMAAEDAFYWTSICKYELGEYDTAVEQLTAYLKKYDRKGKWYFPARSLLAQSYAQLERLPLAITTLERSPSGDPYRMTNALRVKRWTAALTK